MGNEQSRRLRVFASAIALIACAAFANPVTAGAQGTEITHCDTAGGGLADLQNAVASGGEWVFHCSPGNHSISVGSTPLNVNSSVTLDASGQTLSIVSSGDRVFNVNGGELVLDDLVVSGSRYAPFVPTGANGTSGTNGTTGTQVPCDDGQTVSGTGGNGTPPVDNAVDGGDGLDVEGGAIKIFSGATVSIYGGKVQGIIQGGTGGHGGRGGDGGSGGRGATVVGGPDGCAKPIYGGTGGVATDAAHGADGGDGGDAKGGGVFVSSGGTLNVSGTTFQGVAASAGAGGAGGDGGIGGWAGRGDYGGKPNGAGYLDYYGQPGLYSGTGGDGGLGGKAGEAKGGAIYNAGTVNLTDATFLGAQAVTNTGGTGGFGGKGGNGGGSGDAPSGSGGDGSNGGVVGDAAGGAVYSTGTLNVYSAVFDHTVVGGGSLYGGSNGGDGGWGGNTQIPDNSRFGIANAIGGNAGSGAAGGDALGASIFGGIDYHGCANFTGDKVAAGVGGIAGHVGAGLPDGSAGSVGIQGLAGQVDPVGFAPYPCPAGPPAEGPPGSQVCKDGVDNDNDKLIDDADPGCKAEDPKANADKNAPDADISGKKKQKLGKTVDVTVACNDEACKADANGVVNLPGASAAKRVKLKPVSKSIPKGGKATLKLKIPAKLKKSIKKALKAHKKVSAKLNVVVSDTAGNKSTFARSVNFKP